MYSIKDVRLIKFKSFFKGKEMLTPYTAKDNVPFNVKRIFFIGNVSKESKRGSHAHIKTSQIFICYSGKISVKCFDGKNTKLFRLKDQSVGLYVPPTIWYDILYQDKKNSLMVITDKKYLINDYIETVGDYLKFKKK